MKKITQKFDEIWAKADAYNRSTPWPHRPRFHRCMDFQKGRLSSFGIYDFDNKKYVIFEMINTVGSKDLPQELVEMERLVNSTVA